MPNINRNFKFLYLYSIARTVSCGTIIPRTVPVPYCVFHEEPPVALSRFFFAIARYFLIPGVFVGLFGGQRAGIFFGGGHFGEIGPF